MFLIIIKIKIIKIKYILIQKNSNGIGLLGDG